MDNRTVGVLGGGQLGRMLVAAGHRLGIRVAILDPEGSQGPAGQVASLCIEGSFQDAARIKELASLSDIITVEVEHVNTHILEELEDAGHKIRPSAKTIRTIQDKFVQKVHLAKAEVALTEFAAVGSIDEAHEAGAKFGYPFMIKARRLGYGGKGNYLVKSSEALRTGFDQLGGRDLYAEKHVPFVKELAIMVVRTRDDAVCYPVVETTQSDDVCRFVVAPARISPLAAANAHHAAKAAVQSFDGIGIYGVEMFLMADESVLVNEIAPRPHNSGHYTIEGCELDQFEAHLRAILDLPVPRPKLRVGAAMMINVLAESTNIVDSKRLLSRALEVPGAGVHWYGKTVSRPGRKVAHVTVTADNMHVLKHRVEQLGLPDSQHGLLAQGPRVAVIMGSDSDLPTMKEAAEVLADFDIPYEVSIISAHRTPTRMFSFAQSAAERGVQVIIAGAGGAAHLPGMVAALTSLPVIGVPMKTSALNGNDSLLSIVQMPTGVPVATVAIGNATNAGLLAVRILAAQDAELLHKMGDYMNSEEERVLRASAKLESSGIKNYLEAK